MKRILCAALMMVSLGAMAADDVTPFLGRWALTIPGGGAGWLGVTQEKGYLDAHILWGGGSVVPTASTYVENGKLYVTRVHTIDRKDADGNVIRKQTFTETLAAEVDGDKMTLERHDPSRSGKGARLASFEGNRIPDLPDKPNLKKVKFGKPVNLLKENSSEGWTLTNDRQTNGWSVKDGVLTNNAIQPEGKHVSFGNLRTVDEFEDFNLKLEVNVPQGSNSGVYLRGIYEVQVHDSYGKPVDSHNMGAIYSRITPSVAAEKPFGEWQSLDITLVDRHVTVILNGKTIIDNEPLQGCTGGAMWSDEFRPGPLFLQGDHGVVSYRNVALTPVKG